MDNTKVVMIAGKARSGKDTVANMLAEKLDNTHRLALAAPMKDIVADMLDIRVEELEELKNNPDTPHRGYLQRFGQKAKEYFGNNCWVDYLQHVVNNLPNSSVVIVSDFRYPNEELPNSITVNVTNNRVTTKDSHSSENALNGMVFNITIVNNGTLSDLDKEVEKLATYIKMLQMS